MAHARVADREGEDLQISRVVANPMNKKSRTADKECISGLDLGEGLTIPHPKIPACYTGRRNWTDPLVQGRDHWRGVVNTVMNLWVP
jgi:hypothetical protein